MKRTIALLFCLLMMTMPLAGCIGGDDDDDDSSDTPEPELSDWNVHFTATAADLPTCNDDTNGRLYYVEADNQFQVCKTSGWEVIAIQGADGAQGVTGAQGFTGEQGVAGAQGPIGIQGIPGADGKTTLISILSSNNCQNGGYSFEIGTDDNGDGVLTPSEVSLVTDVCDGVSGSDGTDGAQGPQGPPGVDGSDGTDGAQGPPGVDGADGNDGQNGMDGQDGSDGMDGLSSLVNTDIEQPGNNCPDGGLMIEMGIDWNNDGMLDPSEISNTEYVCDGADGIDGVSSLVNTYSEQPGNNCPDGGLMIEIGIDWNNNGILDAGESTHTEYVCDGAQGDKGDKGDQGYQGLMGYTGNPGYNSLISSSTEAAGPNCASGGLKLEIGQDANYDNQLDSSEISSTLYICDGEDGVAVSIPWIDITGIPTDIADGDDDTTYSGADFAISGHQCNTGQVMGGIAANGLPICVFDVDTTFSGTCPSGYYMFGVSSSGMPMCSSDSDTTYDGDDFATSGQQCSTGQVMKGITSNGLVICVIDIDTSFADQCSSGLVMRGVSSSGSAICVSDSDTTYDGDDFATSNQLCTYGYSVYGISNTGDIICTQTQINAGYGLELNGNFMQLKTSGCSAGEILKRNPGNYDWDCVPDSDTTYDGDDFATSDQACSSSQKVLGINANGDIICTSDLDTDTTYSGADFALSNQNCPSGMVVGAISASGAIICNPDIYLSESEVDAYVSNNNYQQRVYANCPVGQYMTEIFPDGSVLCEEPAPPEEISYINLNMLGQITYCFDDGTYQIGLNTINNGLEMRIFNTHNYVSAFYMSRFVEGQVGGKEIDVGPGTVYYTLPDNDPWMATLNWWTPDAPDQNHYSATIMSNYGYSGAQQSYQIICTVTEHSTA